MPTIAEVRQKFPQYNDMSDEQLADAIHAKFYSDIPKPEYLAKIGLSPSAPAEPAFSGAVLPFSKDALGAVSFDSDAGLLGLGKDIYREAKSGLSLPGDVYAGRVDPRSDEAVGRSALLAGLTMPVNPGARGAGWAGARLPGRSLPVTPPAAKELIDEGAKGFEALRGMGVDYHPASVANHMAAVRHEMEMAGLHADQAGQTFKVLSQLESPGAAKWAPLSELVRARSLLGNIATDNIGKTEGRAANILKRRIEEFIKESDPASVMAGPAAAAGKTLDEANANYAAGKRSNLLNRGEKNAERQAQSAHSGANLDNTIRRRAAWILDENYPKRRAGWNAEELKALGDVVSGKGGRNALRRASNYMGGGGGLGGLAAGGTGVMGGLLLGDPYLAAAAGVVVPATGAALKAGQNRLAKGALKKADELVRSRSPLYERMLQDASSQPTPALRRAALNRALILMHEEQQFEQKRRAGRAT